MFWIYLKTIVENGNKPNKVMHDNGKQFTSKIFKGFLKKNKIKDNQFQKAIHNYKEKSRHKTR